MKTLWSSSSRMCSRETIISKSLREILGRNEIRFLSSSKQIGITFSNSINMERHKRRNQPVFASSLPSSSPIQETLPDEQTQIQDTSKTVHVKFQLQRKCSFGEQFLLLGDDTMFGSWDPLSAIPLDWSEGDIWTVELDVPIGKLIKYKFILKEITGDILWQPGLDRVLQTWETTKVISVLEDWENAELQMILEEEFVAKNADEFIVDSGMKIIADNIIGSENFTSSVAENNAGPTKEATVNNGNDFSRAMNNGRPMALKSSKEMKNEENEFSYEGVPVLVPGLTPISTIDSEEKSSLESDNRISDNSSSQAEKLKEHGEQEKPNTKSPHSEDSNETMIQIQEEHGARQETKYDSEDQKVQALKQIESVYENDIHWGQTTLQKLLNNFGF